MSRTAAERVVAGPRWRGWEPPSTARRSRCGAMSCGVHRVARIEPLADRAARILRVRRCLGL